MGKKSSASSAAALLRVRMILDGLTYDEDLGAQTAVSHSNLEGLNDALITHSARFAVWSMLEAVARKAYRETDRRLRERRSELFLQFQRERARKEGRAPLLTAEAIRHRIVLDKRYRQLSDEVLSARELLERVSVGRKTLRHQKDTLISVASNLRVEMDSHMSVRGPRLPEPETPRLPPPPPTRRV